MLSLADFGWRDGVLVVVACAGIYLVLMVLRLLKVGKARRAAAGNEGATASGPIFGSEPMVDLSQQLPRDFFIPPQEPTAPPAGRAAEGAAIAAAEADFARHLARSSVEMEMQQLRRESATLHDEVVSLREELSSLKAARNVSPLYSEAMSLAQRGVPADGIAGQCGISLAEAELVAALARGQSSEEPFDITEDQNGGYSDPRARTGTHG
jgi:hypothetical protein